MTPLIHMDQVDKVYANGTLALHHVDLAVYPAQFVSLLGPSGCGKSTALRLIAGLSAPSRGRVARAQGAEQLGFVFQEPTLMPWASVFDNVYLPLRLAGVGRPAARARIVAALERVGLSGFADAYPRELSGGMKMRASIARALLTEPRLLLMDEPFAALDEITRHKLNDDLLDLWRQRDFTVVFVTHSVYESVYLSNRIAVMAPRPGRIVADIAVDAPYPRDESFRASKTYIDTCHTVSTALKAAMTTA